MSRTAHNAIKWTPTMIQFLRDNYKSKTNRELAEALGLKMTTTRTKCYELGLRKMQLQYWTPEQVAFLKANYKEMGDTELAEIFDVKWQKDKGWSKKHIEKKRRYLKLKRTKAQIARIKKRNVAMGRFSECANKMWETIGEAPVGTRRVWYRPDNTPFVVIKTKKGFIHYNRYLWEQTYGPIPKGMNVIVISADRVNYTAQDLVLMTNAELAAHNSAHRLPDELKQTQKLINKLNRKIKNYEQYS